MIIQNMLRTCHQSDYANNLGLMRTLPEGKPVSQHKVGVFIGSSPVINEEFKDRIAAEFSKNTVCFFAKPGKEKTWDDLYTGVDASFRDFEYVCVINPQEIQPSYQYGLFESLHYLPNIIGSPDSIDSIIRFFEDDSDVAMIAAPYPVGTYHAMLTEWNYVCERWFAENNHVIFNSSKMPNGSGTGVFWIRTSCLPVSMREAIQVNEKTVKYTGELFDLLMSLIVQIIGKLTVTICSNDQLIDNHVAAEGIIANLHKTASQISLKTHLRLYAKRRLPKPLYKFLKRRFKK